MSKITRFIIQVAGSEKIFIIVVLLLVVGVLMENLLFLYIVGFIFTFLMVVVTVNWENVRRK